MYNNHVHITPSLPLSLSMETQSKAVTTSNLDIIVESNPSESRLQELGIKSWPK